MEGNRCQFNNTAGGSDSGKSTFCFKDIREFVCTLSSSSSSSTEEICADTVLADFANFYQESSRQRRNVMTTLDLSPDVSTESSKVGLGGILALVQIAEAGHFRYLKILNLSHNRLQMDQGIMVLADSFISEQWGNLEVLGLSSNQVDDDGAQALAESFWCGALGKLRSLDLSLNSIGDAGAKSLAEAFKSGHLSNFQMLNLSLNKFRHEGVVALAEAFQSGHLTTFRSLDLSGNAIGETGTNALVTSFISGHLIHLHSVDLCGCDLQDGGIMALAEIFQSPSHVCNIESLVLLDNVVGSSALTALVASFLLGEWQNLKLQRGNKLQVERGKPLANVSEFSEAEPSRQSRALYLPQSNLDEDMVIMALGTTLDLTSALALNSEFKSLDLQGIGIGETQAICLADSFRTGKWRNLRNLNLSRNDLGDKGLVALAKAFRTPHLAKLERLGLAENKISVVGAKAFAESCALGQCHVNQSLVIDLRGNGIGDDGIEALVQLFLFGKWEKIRLFQATEPVPLYEILEVESGCANTWRALYLSKSSLEVLSMAKYLESKYGNLEILDLPNMHTADPGSLPVPE